MKQNHILSRLPGATQISSDLCAAAYPASGPDRERRPNEQTVDAIFDDKPLMLNAARRLAKPGTVISDWLDNL